MRPFGEAQSKAMRAYAQSGQYHTIVESRVRLTDRENGKEIFGLTKLHFSSWYSLSNVFLNYFSLRN